MVRLYAVSALFFMSCIRVSVAVMGVEPDLSRNADAAIRILADVVSGVTQGTVESAVVPMILVVRLENTGSVGVTVRHVSYRIEVAGVEVGHGGLDEVITVPVGEERTVRIPFEVHLAAIMSIAFASSDGVRFDITGEASLDTGLFSKTVIFKANQLTTLMGFI